MNTKIKNSRKKIGLKISILGAIATTFAFSACEKFLEEKPSKTSALVVTTTDQLEALLNEYKTFYSEQNRTAIFSTDDFEMNSTLYKARPTTFNMALIQFSFWDIKDLPWDTRDVYWSNEYKKIFTANMVLSYLDQVSGSETDKAILKADAHFIRAYSYFQLANTYCLPFTEQNRNELGLPIKQTTSFEELDERRPLHEVYALIENDLNEALKTTLPLNQNGVNRSWRLNKAAANGLAARYYLVLGNYQKSLDFANESLKNNSSLMDYNTEMSYGRSSNFVINPGKPDESRVTLEYPRTHNNRLDVDLTDAINWKELSYLRYLDHSSWWYIPSPDLLALYDKKNDLRYKYHIVENYSYDRTLTNPAYSYPGYVAFYKNAILSGITTAEMLLIRAECQARLGLFNEAMGSINTLRAKRMTPGEWVNLVASNKEEAIKKILEERRRELPFTQRWFDVRRYNHNEYTADDVVLSKEFYPYNATNVDVSGAIKTYTLPKGSRRYATPIPQTEIISSQGRIIQNTY